MTVGAMRLKRVTVTVPAMKPQVATMKGRAFLPNRRVPKKLAKPVQTAKTRATKGEISVLRSKISSESTQDILRKMAGPNNAAKAGEPSGRIGFGRTNLLFLERMKLALLL
jgi:hypothetical protein